MKNTVELDQILKLVTSKPDKLGNIKRLIYQKITIILGAKLYKDLSGAQIKGKEVIETLLPFFQQLSINSQKSEPPFEKENTDAIREITKMGTSIISSHIIFKPTRFKSGFVGENLTLKEFESLDEEEKIGLDSLLWGKNRDWLMQKFQELNGEWITVIDGEVVTFSSDIDKYPQESEILNLCQDKRKFPFIFVNERILRRISMIEEGSSAWIKTNIPEDYYPTVKIQITSSNSSSELNLIADFDTGAYDIYLGMERFIDEGLIAPPSVREKPYGNSHLGKNFQWYFRPLFISPISEESKTRKEKFSVICVRNWGSSPFVEINPNRTALVGRRLFLKIGYSVLLQFANRKTEIY